MAIRSIKKATLTCDDCGKELAILHTTSQALAVFEEDTRYTEVRCISHASTDDTRLEGK